MINNNYSQTFAISPSTTSTVNSSATTIAANNGKDLPQTNNVSISDAGQKKLSEEVKTGNFIDFRSEDGAYKKGLMLGLGANTINDWKNKGLDIADQAIIAAGEAFQQGFSQLVENNGSSLSNAGSVAVNKHQAVINSQVIPEWFEQEYENTLAAMDNKEMKEAFKSGDLFYVTEPSARNSSAVANYTKIANGS